MSSIKNKKARSERNKKVFVAMSGGVDSSVTAALLKKKGYEVIGAHMKCWSQGGLSTGFRAESCSAEQDAEDARRAAEVLGIPFYVFDFEKEYKDKVVEYMIDGYRKGVTPNPDVMCNKEIKFGLFLKMALEMGADHIATGHYVRLRHRVISDKGKVKSEKSLFAYRSSLFTARDAQKDQSYFLWTLTQEQLKHCLFPIGEYTKPEVRKLAKKFGLPNAEKKDSQGICFLGQVTLKDFLGNYIPEKKGLVLNTAGKVVGEHKGAYFYTIGQRHLGIKNYELGIKGQNERRPSYVAEKDIKTNTLLVVEGDDNPALFCKEVRLKNINLINPIIHNSKFMIPVFARVRYRQSLVRASFIIHNSLFKLVFDHPQKFVASGQSAVFYSADERNLPAGRQVLGGGVIV